MKKVLFSTVVLILAFAVMTTGTQAEVLMGVKPAGMVQSSYFGFLASTNLVLQFGLDYARVKVKTEVAGDDTEESVNMFMPHGGARIYLKPRTKGEASPYVMLDVFKAFTSYESGAEYVGVEDDDELTSDVLSPWGFNLAIGAEYFFSESFSMGGEYGLRYLMSKGKHNEADLEVSTNLGMTYGVISLNFAI